MKTIKQAAKDYTDSLKLNHSNNVGKSQFEEYAQTDFIAGAEFARERIAREVIESIFNYEKESNSKIIDFDRTVEDVLKIYLEKE